MIVKISHIRGYKFNAFFLNKYLYKERPPNLATTLRDFNGDGEVATIPLHRQQREVSVPPVVGMGPADGGRLLCDGRGLWDRQPPQCPRHLAHGAGRRQIIRNGLVPGELDRKIEVCYPLEFSASRARTECKCECDFPYFDA